MIYYDFHSHILPGIDDGAANAQISVKMLEMLFEQGVAVSVLTPHFCSDEIDFDEFIENRRTAYRELLKVYDRNNMPELMVGAEVKLLPKVSKFDLSELAFSDDFILLEMPDVYGEWIVEEMERIMLKGYKIVIAHVERPYMNFSKQQFEKIVDYRNFIYQLNVSAIKNGLLRRHFIKEFNKYGGRFILGSDAHNLESRRPDFDAKALSGRDINKGFMQAVRHNSEQIILKGRK